MNDPATVRLKISKQSFTTWNPTFVSFTTWRPNVVRLKPYTRNHFISNSNFTSTFQLAHVIEFFNQHKAHPVNTNLTKSRTLKFHPKRLWFFFWNSPFIFFRTPEILHLNISPPLHTLKIFSSDTWIFFSQKTLRFFSIKTPTLDIFFEIQKKT